MLRAMRTPLRLAVAFYVLFGLLILPLAPHAAGSGSGSGEATRDASTARASIDAMKASPRGPFERIRWFCNDGTVQAPKAYACRDHGGGVQHGEWSQQTLDLRSAGYPIANLLAGIDASPFLGNAPDFGLLNAILMERFLMKVDDGWIFRGARSYRGALQIEDEEAGARRIALGILADPAWMTPARFAQLRETIRLLPLPRDEASASHIRHEALELAEKDKAFTPLRAKIHNAPDAGDADKVRAYANAKASATLRARYEALAKAIDGLYASQGAVKAIKKTAAAIQNPRLAADLEVGAGELAASRDPARRFSVAARLLGRLRDELATAASPEARLSMLETSLVLEDEVFTAGTALLADSGRVSRRGRLRWLRDGSTALYGIGFINKRHLQGIRTSLIRIQSSTALTVDAYRSELRYLARPAEWSGRWLEFNFGETVALFHEISDHAHLFSQDRLRGSPLLFYSAVLDGLTLDANHQAGIQHVLFGRKVGVGLRALNPGLARGRLVAPRSGEMPAGGFGRRGVYLLPESTSDLPRVEGILTRGEGSSLSHLQLLSRNLGIPNVVVGDEHVGSVIDHDGDEVVLAVSPQGVVQLEVFSPKWETVFGKEQNLGGLVIRPDLTKLDISKSAMIPLARLRATDSGRNSGPKGANLGELRHYFGDAVPDGFVITFGAFRKVLDQPIEAGGPSVFEWMKSNYDRFETLQGAQKEQEVAAFLRRLRNWILGCDPGRGFRQGLALSLDRLGQDGSFGVFVRSDTNVEDLPGFTGAGLNLTVANVVGTANVLKAIREVWASPFTERAFGWRQNNMKDPEYVFPAVVVQRSFPSEKSGVMVTVDVDTGDPRWLTVAVNEGVGGAVDGQAAESLLIDAQTGETRYLAQATAPRKAVLSASGGVTQVPASGAESTLQPGEIQQLVAFARTVAERFPTLKDEAGATLPADVEFGFRNGKLTLLQIRPFVESRGAQQSLYLSELDAAFRERGHRKVDLDAVPWEPKS